jgi:magnesium chelatase family protein
MSETVLGATLLGVDAVPIEVEVDLLRRLPKVCVVGLAASAVKESAERVRSAIASADCEFPRMRVVINLAPADLPKRGTAFDLPMAVGILAADGQVPTVPISSMIFVGELSLGGELRPVRGGLSMALLARSMDRTLVMPRENAAQAALVPGARVVGAATLAEVVAMLKGELALPPASPDNGAPPRHQVDLCEVRGQAVARRALEIAAAGAHHLLMVGPPGCGKSMLARRLPTILPPMEFEEAVETSRVHSASGLLDEARLMSERPFRAPHHSVTVAGLVGNAALLPGEVSLAHNGVLFMDEAPEFSRSVLEVLRTPLEDGAVRVTRAEGTIEYPAGITLVMASNPCPCGRRGSNQPCACTEQDVRLYKRRLSGPILDRIDLHIELQPVSPTALLRDGPGEPSSAVRARVVAARARQSARGQTVPNGRLSAADLEGVLNADPAARDVLFHAVERFGLSGRVSTRVSKVARTLADLAGSPNVTSAHMAEALGFRPLEGT